MSLPLPPATECTQGKLLEFQRAKERMATHPPTLAVITSCITSVIEGTKQQLFLVATLTKDNQIPLKPPGIDSIFIQSSLQRMLARTSSP